MKKFALTIMMLTSLNATAAMQSPINSDLTVFNKEMGQLEQVDIKDKVYISTLSDGYVAVADSSEYLSEFTQVERITDQQAEEMKLAKERSFYVYSSIGTEQVAKNIKKHLEKDSPKYFTVTFYNNQKGNETGREFLAHVVEYSGS
ncbi:hypothetical protein L4D77_13455 [Photobacterium frigidiphilum]|uniref:hypothetical protein n=1 Tax=Photobacterium frigidiphilum TaxID=264736 RepID=UPI003D0967CE